ncbi:MAG: NUDIX domain-containing protein [Pleurocapsa minor GSE-CHR-MK-17-07R]|jgi:ADP-ribose pyrophosphatase YjhB (NUDIX family)|nr:NUDIX domain-containing protein [Pleurocapsa minor GSE-CHR-MK 17-07R]
MMAGQSQPLRLGVMSAVFRHDGALLLSRRGDLNVWALPGGRLDAGETLGNAAARETLEEAGVRATGWCPLGLYFLEGFGRLNVLYTAQADKSLPASRTPETLENRYFPPANIPPMPLAEIAADAAGHVAACRVLVTPPRELSWLKRRLALRYVGNMLRGRPEPKFPEFQVRAVGVIFTSEGSRVLTLKPRTPGASPLRALPRIACDGSAAPWDLLQRELTYRLGIQPVLRWCGLWQHAAANRIELVFSADVPHRDLFRGGEWSGARIAPLPDRDAAYVRLANQPADKCAIWTVNHDETLHAGDIIRP